MTEGTLTEIDGRPALRFTRRFAHPIERVWRAVSTYDELRRPGRWTVSEVHRSHRRACVEPLAAGNSRMDRRAGAYCRCMADAAEIRGRKRRSNRSVLGGIGVMTIALLASSWELAPAVATTAAAIAGFVLLMYGVHVGWLVFYDRESDGPAS